MSGPQYDEALRQIRKLDKMACEANSLWRQLESMKLAIARRANISPTRLRAAGIFVEAKKGE